MQPLFQPRQTDRTKIIILFAASLLLWFSLFIYLPTLPLFLNRKTGSLAMVGMVLSMYGLAQLVFRMPVGLAADFTGRAKPLITGGFLAMGVGALLLYYSEALPVLMLARLLTGLGAATWVVLMSTFTALFPVKKIISATAILTIANGLGKMLSTYLSGFLNETCGDSMVFFLGAGAAFAAAFLLLFIVIEPRTPVAFSLQELGNLIFQRRLMVPTLGHGAAMLAVWAIPLSFLSVRAEELGAGDIETGLLLGLHLSAFTISNIINSFIGWRVSTKKLVLFAILVFSLGNGIAALSVSFFWLLISGLLSGFGFGFLQSCFLGLSMQGVHPNQRATAMGVHQALYSLGIFIGPWIGGVLADRFGIPVMFGIVTGITLVLFLITVWMIEE